MTTNNAVNTGLTGTTGTGKFVGDTSAILVTPTIGAATATSITFNPTTGGIVGTTTNNNADAGKVGEIISSVILVGSAVSLVTATPKTITSISITAGDWDVWGSVWTNPAGGTTTTDIIGSINTTTNVLSTTPALGTSFSRQTGFSVVGTSNVIPIPGTRVSLSGTTTYFLVMQVSFSGSTLSGFGNIIARRVR